MARVLVVDDAAFMRKVVSDALTKAGHEVIAEATNGQEAVDQFRALKPDLATLDITMPEKDGLTALSEIMSLDPNARVVGDRRRGEVVDVGPVVAGLGLEARALEPDDRHPGELRMGRDARGERMRGVHDGPDAVALDVAAQAVGAAEDRGAGEREDRVVTELVLELPRLLRPA